MVMRIFALADVNDYSGMIMNAHKGSDLPLIALMHYTAKAADDDSNFFLAQTLHISFLGLPKEPPFY